jgi:SAM-dependent methyltransferase
MSTPAGPREFWESRYASAGRDFVFGEAPNDFLVREAHRLPVGCRILSVADGEGRNSVFLAQQGHEVEALEFAPSAIAKARALAAAKSVSVKVIEADVFAWEWPEQCYDAVVAVFIQFADPVARVGLFKRMLASLVPEGLLLIQGYTPKQIEYGTGGPSAVENLYTEEWLLEMFSDHELVVLRTHESVIEEGAGHSGLSALVDVVVRKR